MALATGMFGGGAAAPYATNLISIFGAESFVALWDQTETTGIVAADASGNNRPGAYSGPTLAQRIAGYNNILPLYDGVNDIFNTYTASFRTAFPAAEGTIGVVACPYNAGVWTDGISRSIIRFDGGGSNYIFIDKRTTNGQLRYNYIGGGVTKEVIITGQNWTTPKLATMTWSIASDEVRMYLGTDQVGTTQTSVTVFDGLPQIAGQSIGCMQAGGVTPGSFWYGWLGFAFVLNRAAPPAEIALAAVL